MSNVFNQRRKELLHTAFGVFLLGSYSQCLTQSPQALFLLSALVLAPVLVGATLALWLSANPRRFHAVWALYQTSFLFLLFMSPTSLDGFWIVSGFALSLLCLTQPNVKPIQYLRAEDVVNSVAKLCLIAEKNDLLLLNEVEWEEAIQKEPNAAILYWRTCPDALRARIEAALGFSLGYVTPIEIIKDKSAQLARITEGYLSAIPDIQIA